MTAWFGLGLLGVYLVLYVSYKEFRSRLARRELLVFVGVLILLFLIVEWLCTI